MTREMVKMCILMLCFVFFCNGWGHFENLFPIKSSNHKSSKTCTGPKIALPAAPFLDQKVVVKVFSWDSFVGKKSKSWHLEQRSIPSDGASSKLRAGDGADPQIVGRMDFRSFLSVDVEDGSIHGSKWSSQIKVDTIKAMFFFCCVFCWPKIKKWF